jgi:hypothetical protein
MKKLLLILLMFLSVCTYAQRRKHARKKARHSTRHRSRHRRMEEDVAVEETPTYPFFSVDSVTKKLVLKDPPLEQDRPLVMINGNIYTGRLADIKRENILDVSVIKKKGAKMMYGPKAAAGALIIKTRQPLPADLPTTLLTPPKPNARQKPFILNDQPTYGQVTDIDPTTILKIDTLIQPKFIGAKDNDTTIVVTTKKYGTKLYQWKFGTLSKAYKAYIRARHGKDSKVVYVLPDGTQLTGDDKLKLFDQAKADIKSVSFTRPHGTRNNRTPATLIIEPTQPGN